MKSNLQKRSFDISAISKLVQDFGLLLIADDFERYTMDQSLLKIAQRTRTKARPNLLADAHLEKFLSVLPTLDIEVNNRAPLIEHIQVLDRLSSIEAFVKVLDKTVDFKIEIRSLLKAMRRKFDSSKDPEISFRIGKRLLSEELEANCRDISSIIREFHVPDETGDMHNPWDINLWTILMDAHRRHSKTGTIHRMFYARLERYQQGRGSGAPKAYRRAALVVLLAECFEDFCTAGHKSVIHDRSLDGNPLSKKPEDRRQPEYDSHFANFLLAFANVADVGEELARDNHSLDKYRKMLRKRAQQPPFRITEKLKSSMQAPEIEIILKDLDTIKV